MEDGDFEFAEMMAKIVMDVERKKARRDAAQQAVERVVGRVGQFNGDDVPKFLGIDIQRGQEPSRSSRVVGVFRGSSFGGV